jgi:hypothetical protein
MNDDERNTQMCPQPAEAHKQAVCCALVGCDVQPEICTSWESTTTMAAVMAVASTPHAHVQQNLQTRHCTTNAQLPYSNMLLHVLPRVLRCDVAIL